MRIHLIRHPRPEVGPGICYGRSDLTVSIQEQAEALAALLPQLQALPPATPIFSSPLARCATLARQLSVARGGVAVQFDARLAEMDFGDWELRSWDVIPRDEINAWAADLINYRPGGGESVLQMAARVQAFHVDLARSPFECAIVVCHAGSIRLSLACQPGRTVKDIAAAVTGSAHQIAYGEHCVLERPGTGMQ